MTTPAYRYELPVKILGLGKHLPEKVITNAELEDEMGLDEGWIARRTGILERRAAPRKMTTSQMAAYAAMEAMENAHLKMSDIDVIVFAGAGPEQVIPCTAVFVQELLGSEARGIACYDVDATCFSFGVGMYNVACQIALGHIKHALVVTAELPSRGLLDYEHPESASLFGDGAAAAVIGPAGDSGSKFVRFEMRSFSEGKDLARIRGGGTRHLPTDPDYDERMQLFEMDGKAIFKAVLRIGEGIYGDFWEDNIPREAYDCVIPHQVNAHGVSLYAKKGGFTEQQVFSNLAKLGNMVSASLPVGLYDAVAEGKVERGSKVCLLGTAAGITIGGLSFIY